MKTLLAIILLFVVGAAAISAQTKTNLEIINKLIDESVAQADSVIGGGQQISLEYTSSSTLQVLKPEVLQSFTKRGYTLTTSSNSTAKSVEFTLTNAKVEYKDSFTDGLFGGTMIVRNIAVTGAIVITNDGKTLQPQQFHKSYLDTVKLDEISNLEDKALPFTQSNLPSLPLLSNLWEPIIAVGTLIVTAVLLFTVRSK